jgi:hypothetical protein
MPLRTTIFALLIPVCGHCFGNDSIPAKDSSMVIITLQNAQDKLSKIDSVFVVFDRYDLRGAGIVKKVFYPDTDNQIHVTVPKGRYYMNIYCLGIYNKECFDRILFARAHRLHSVFLRLQASALYHQGYAKIPAEHFDPSHLAILNFASK